MASGWTVERLRAMSPTDILKLYRNAKVKSDTSNDVKAQELVALIIENDLLKEPGGGLPHDHPIMQEIAEICADPEAIAEAVGAAESGLPPLAGMEHRLVAALGSQYGMYYTVHHAGYCIATAMLDLGWQKGPQRPMPVGFIAKSATTFYKKDA